MSVDVTRLRELAEGRGEVVDVITAAERWYEAATPDAVLALLARLERAEADADRRGQMLSEVLFALQRDDGEQVDIPVDPEDYPGQPLYGPIAGGPLWFSLQPALTDETWIALCEEVETFVPAAHREVVAQRSEP